MFKSATEATQQEDKVIRQVVEVRNNTAHATGGISSEKFAEMWNVLEECLRTLGHDASKLKKLRDTPLLQYANEGDDEVKVMGVMMVMLVVVIAIFLICFKLELLQVIPQPLPRKCSC